MQPENSFAFAFAFENPKFSDRKLRLIICAEKEQLRSKRRKAGPDSMNLHGGQSNVVLHVSAAILAKDSLFFRMLFDGDSFKESSEKICDVWLKPHEKEAFLDVLKFIYMTELEAVACDKLLLVWRISDRFIVDSCVDICIQRLLDLPFSFNSSCDVLEASTTMQQTEKLQKVASKALSYLSNHFKDKGNYCDFKQLSPQVLELLLGLDSLAVWCEEEVYELLRAWVKENCKDEREADAAWKKFGPLVRWPMMEVSSVKARLQEPNRCKVSRDLLVEALLYHTSTDEEKEAMESNSSNSHRFQRRSNSSIPLRCVSMGSFTNQVFTFFEITLEEWARIEKLKYGQNLCTQRFYLCGSTFWWLVSGARLGLQKWSGPSSFTRLDISIAIWDASSNAYVEKWKRSSTMESAVEWFCFEKGVDKLITDVKVTRFKAEVQIHKLK